MLILVKVIGIFIAGMGLAIILNPKVMKKMLAFWREGKRFYLGATIRILFGVIFLLAASQAKYPAVMAVLGALSLLGGILILILGLEKIKRIFDWWDKKAFSFLRLVGILPLAIGVLIIHSV